ncbi:MAG: hypothetical protein M1830_005234, partial [Pleopsidium flavum]
VEYPHHRSAYHLQRLLCLDWYRPSDYRKVCLQASGSQLQRMETCCSRRRQYDGYD